LIIDIAVFSPYQLNSSSISSPAPARMFGCKVPPLSRARKRTIEVTRELLYRRLHLQTNKPDRCAIVEQHDENESSRDVGYVHRLAFSLMTECREIGLTNEPRQLIVGTEVGGGEGRESHWIESERLAHCRDELSRAIDEQRRARAGLRRKREIVRAIAFRSSCSNDQLLAAGCI
jgi:hypothetical protein